MDLRTGRSDAHLSFRISRYGVNGGGAATSLGITHYRWQEGFPDMSRLAAKPHGLAGQVAFLSYPTRNFATLGISVTPLK